MIDYNSLLTRWLTKLIHQSKIRQNMNVRSASCCMQNLRGEKVEWVRLAGQGWADYVCQTRRIGDLAERLVGNDWRILRKQDPDYFSPSLKFKQTHVWSTLMSWTVGRRRGGNGYLQMIYIRHHTVCPIEKYFEEMIWSWLMHVRYLTPTILDTS